MIKVLIVDDSISSRTDLKTMLNWEQHGCEIIGEANNGSEAIRIIQTKLPDLVITDMNMPVMDGVKFIEHIKQNYPTIQVMALSAYDDFNFVRQSLKQGAVDYLLKHQLDADTLRALLQTITAEIQRDQSYPHDANPLPGSKKVLRHEFLLLLVTGVITDMDEVAASLRQLDIALDMKNLMVTVAEMDDYAFIEERYSPSDREVLNDTFLEICSEMMNEWDKSVIFPVSPGRFALIFSMGDVYSKMYNYNRIFSLLNRIRSEIKRIMNITASFGVCSSCQKIRDLPQAYEEARLRLENKFYKGKNEIYIENAEKLKDGFYCLDIQDEKAIYSALRNLDYERVHEHIEQIFGKISELRLRSQSTRLVCAELINILNKVCQENGIDASSLYSVEDVPYSMMEKYETLRDIKEWVLRLYGQLLSRLEFVRFHPSLSKATQMAVTFIQKNYHQDISLTDVAAHAGVSPSYLSRLFKEECGVGFAEYMNRTRIKHAKWYIEQGEYKLSEVVSRVGFNNYNYFFKVFKKMEGVTPLEYEKTCGHTG